LARRLSSAKITEVLAYHNAQWLLIRYRQPGGRAHSVGVVLYLPSTEEIYIQFRGDLPFVDPEDHETLAGASQTFRDIAVDLGSKVAFHWMCESLSNTVFVEGPYTIQTEDPNQTLSELFVSNCEAAA
jgi:hypothetical protein